MKNYVCHYGSPLGEITLSGDEEALTGLWFDGQAHFGSTLAEGAEERVLPVFQQACRWLDRYFLGENPGPIPPVRLCGTAHQTAVWQLLTQIPYGQTATYGELAARFPGKTSARAIGAAVARNPVSILVPCHRVVGANGRLTGYAGGLERKARLLELEQNGI